VPAGAKLVICPWVLHRNERHFPEPERFLPERWKDRPRATLPRGSYIPFSAGSRSCLGERFGLMEATLILARMAQRWTFQPLPTQSDPEWLPQITLRPRGGIGLRASRRQPADFHHD